MKPKFTSLGAFLAFGLVCASCPAQAKDQIVIDLVNEPSTLDPQLQWNPDSYNVYRNIFDNLVTRDNDSRIVPQIATAWKNVTDKQVAFTLRHDVTFQDGSKLTPDDVVFSVRRITDPKFHSPQLGQFNEIVSAEVTGPDQVTLATAGIYPVLLAQLVKLSILPRHVVEKLGDAEFNAHPVGSGPYTFASWRRGISVELHRNPDYWGTPGGFTSAVFRPVPDVSTRLADLNSGHADLVVTLDNDTAAMLATSKNAEARTVLTERVAYFGLNVQKPPLNDLRMRQAIAYAIDKKGIIDGILGGKERPLDELVSPASVGWVDGIKALPYDPQKARALIAQIGAPAKTPLGLLTAPVYDQRIVQAIQQQLADVGLNVTINTVDMANLMKQIESGPAAMPALTFGRWSCTCQDADGILYPLLSSTSGWSTFRDPEMDRALDDARNTLDLTRRLADYRRVHEIVVQQVPIVPLYQAITIYGVARKLQWQPTANESIFLNRMKWQD